jgi:hypothetical protein
VIKSDTLLIVCRHVLRNASEKPVHQSTTRLDRIADASYSMAFVMSCIGSSQIDSHGIKRPKEKRKKAIERWIGLELSWCGRILSRQYALSIRVNYYRSRAEDCQQKLYED